MFDRCHCQIIHSQKMTKLRRKKLPQSVHFLEGLGWGWKFQLETLFGRIPFEHQLSVEWSQRRNASFTLSLLTLSLLTLSLLTLPLLTLSLLTLSLWLGSCKVAAAPHWRSPMLWKTVQHLLSGYFLPKTSNVRRNTRLALAMALNGLENDIMWILHVTHYSPLDWK